MSLVDTIEGTTAEQLRACGSLKWTVPAAGELGAFVAEMDFGTAPPIIAALQAEIGKTNFGYLPPWMAAELGDAVAAWQRDRYGWSVPAADIHPLPDVIKGLELAITHFSRPGSPVILPTPAYMPFLSVPPFLGREIIEVPMINDDGYYTLDLAGLDRAFAAGGHLLIFCNPCNPLGRVYSPEEMAAVAAIVDRHGGRVFSDEIHAPLVYPGGPRHVPYASLSDVTAGHTLTATSASKAWNLPGLKCATMLVTNDPDREAWEQLGMFATHGASTPGVAANTAAFRQGGPWLAEVLAYLDGNRRLLADLLAERLPDVVFRPPDGTYLCWLDCRSLNLPASAGEFVKDRAGVVVNDGPTFGEPGKGFLRLNMATPRPILAEIVDRIARAVDDLRSAGVAAGPVREGVDRSDAAAVPAAGA
jgi:cystathionine beta-lyase